MTTRYLAPTLPPRALRESLWTSLGRFHWRGNATGTAAARSGRRGSKRADEYEVQEAQKGCGSREGAPAPHARIETLGGRRLLRATEVAAKPERGAPFGAQRADGKP
jgi:hypothetical protein